MKQTNTRFLRLITAVSIVGLMATGNSALAGISNTKHNLGSTSNAGNNQTTDTAAICVFCHTPHGADTSAAAPLWNKELGNLPRTGAYTVYDTSSSTTLDAALATDGVNGGAVGSVSIACLSCHDGTQAMDNIINAPGSGGFDPTGGGENGLGFTWTGSTVDPLTGKLASGVALLGTDLSNDHPIGIEYGGGGLSGAAAGTTGPLTDFDFFEPDTGTINGVNVWWVDNGGPGTRERTDMILYNRTFPGGIGPSVECASCHDPHVEQGQAGPNGLVAGATFLRVSNDGSAVCLACHNK